MNSPQIDEQTAKGRFFILSTLRLMGAVMVVIGMLIASGTIDWPIWIGYIVLAAGLVDFFAVPLILAKRWRTPK